MKSIVIVLALVYIAISCIYCVSRVFDVEQGTFDDSDSWLPSGSPQPLDDLYLPEPDYVLTAEGDCTANSLNIGTYDGEDSFPNCKVITTPDTVFTLDTLFIQTEGYLQFLSNKTQYINKFINNGALEFSTNLFSINGSFTTTGTYELDSNFDNKSTVEVFDFSQGSLQASSTNVYSALKNSTITLLNGSVLSFTSNVTIDPLSTIKVDNSTINLIEKTMIVTNGSSVVFNSGIFRLSNGTIEVQGDLFNLTHSSLAGLGTITKSVYTNGNLGSIVRPSKLNFFGDVEIGSATSNTIVYIGVGQGNSTLFKINGGLKLNGLLHVIINLQVYNKAINQSIVVMNFTSVENDFNTIIYRTYNPEDGSFVILNETLTTTIKEPSSYIVSLNFPEEQPTEEPTEEPTHPSTSNIIKMNILILLLSIILSFL